MPTIKYKKKTYAGGSMPVLEMTKAQYDALPAAKQNDGTIYLITDGDGGWEAEDSVYDNTESGLTATNVQDALDEIVSSIPSIPLKENLIIELANSNVITHTAGTPVGYRYGNQMICYISLAFKTTQQRAADIGVFRLRTSDNKQIVPTVPYFLPCMVNSDNVVRWSYKNSDSTAYFNNPVIWNANAEFRITGVFVGDIQ